MNEEFTRYAGEILQIMKRALMAHAPVLAIPYYTEAVNSLSPAGCNVNLLEHARIDANWRTELAEPLHSAMCFADAMRFLPLIDGSVVLPEWRRMGNAALYVLVTLAHRNRAERFIQQREINDAARRLGSSLRMAVKHGLTHHLALILFPTDRCGPFNPRGESWLTYMRREETPPPLPYNPCTVDHF